MRLFLRPLYRKSVSLPNHYYSSIMEMRRTCRASPEKGVSRKVSTIFRARPSPSTLAPMARMLASLCSRVAWAEKQSEHRAARMPFTLFAVMEMPMPVPQIIIPSVALPGGHGLGHSAAVNGIVAGGRGVGPEILICQAPLLQMFFYRFSFSSKPPWSLPIPIIFRLRITRKAFKY